MSALYDYLKHSPHIYLSGLELPELSLPVSKLYFCGYPAGEVPPGITPTNHWVVYVVTGAASSCRIEISPNYPPETQANLLIAHKTYQYTDRSIKFVEMAATNGITLQKVLGSIVDKKRDKYAFDPTGEGCRYWQLTIAKDFASTGIVSSKDVDSLEKVISQYWKSKNEGTPRPVVPGKFL